MKYTICAVLALAMMLTGCDSKPAKKEGEGGSGTKTASNEGGSGSGSKLKGTINVEGSSTVEPISNKAKEMFEEENPDVKIVVSGQGTGNGFKALAKKEADFSDASRPVKGKEFKSCQEAGVKFVEVPVAYDGLSIVVNKENDFIKELNIEQLKMIFREDFAKKKWKEVDPSWPDEDIAIYAPGVNSGTHDYFVEVIGKKDKKGLRPGDEYCTLSENDKTLVTGVKGNKYAIGFFGFSYYEANKDKLKIVPIVDPKTEKAVTPSMATIESGEYAPFSRPLFIYVNTESYKRLEVKKFVDYYLANAKKIVSAAAYVPLPEAVYTLAQENLEKGVVGSHYVDENGEKRSGGLVEVYKAPNLTTEVK